MTEQIKNFPNENLDHHEVDDDYHEASKGDEDNIAVPGNITATLEQDVHQHHDGHVTVDHPTFIAVGTTGEEQFVDYPIDDQQELVRDLRIELKLQKNMLKSSEQETQELQQQYANLSLLQQQQQSQLEAIQQANLKLQQELHEASQDLEQSRRDVVCLTTELQQYTVSQNQSKLEQELNGIEQNNSHQTGPAGGSSVGAAAGAGTQASTTSDWFVLPREVRQLQEQLKRCRVQQTKLSQSHSLEVESLVTQLQEAQTRSNYHEQQLREHLVNSEKTTLKVRKEHDKATSKLRKEHDKEMKRLSQEYERKLATIKHLQLRKSGASLSHPDEITAGGGSDCGTTSSTGSESSSGSDDFLLSESGIVTFTRAEWNSREAAQEKTIQKLMAKIEELEEAVSKQKARSMRPPLLPPCGSSPQSVRSTRTTSTLGGGWPSLPGFSRHGTSKTRTVPDADDMSSSSRSVMTMPAALTFATSLHG